MLRRALDSKIGRASCRERVEIAWVGWQAEDGIRDGRVTGVQTCALPICFYNTKGAVEAGWKYLIVCTVGIAFALFGTIVLYLAAVKAGMKPAAALDWVSLMDAAPRIGFEDRKSVV